LSLLVGDDQKEIQLARAGGMNDVPPTW